MSTLETLFPDLGKKPTRDEQMDTLTKDRDEWRARALAAETKLSQLHVYYVSMGMILVDKVTA